MVAWAGTLKPTCEPQVFPDRSGQPLHRRPQA